MSETPERRHGKRITIKLPVVYYGPDGTVKHGTTENVSRRGMLLVAQSQPAGTRIRVAVKSPDGSEREVVGDVVRSSSDHVAVEIAEADTGLDAIVESRESKGQPG